MNIVGHGAQIAAFRAALSSGRMHHAWLLAGPRGIGKAHFADFAARALLDAEHIDSTGAKLLAAGSHPDFLRMERLLNDKGDKLARSITVDQVRAMRQHLTMTTAVADRRVIIIDSVDDLEGRSGPNAILKSLEEPPANTVFLLVSHQPGRLLPTIRSRCRTLLFAPLDDAAMTSVLDAHRPGLAPAEREALIANAQGSPARALAHAALDLTSIDAALTELATTGDPANAVRSRLAQTLALKAAASRYEAFLDCAPTFIADHARRRDGAALDTALIAWRKARELAQIAIPQSLIAETVVFEMAGYVASLAPASSAAKA